MNESKRSKYNPWLMLCTMWAFLFMARVVVMVLNGSYKLLLVDATIVIFGAATIIISYLWTVKDRSIISRKWFISGWISACTVMCFWILTSSNLIDIQISPILSTASGFMFLFGSIYIFYGKTAMDIIGGLKNTH